MKNLLITIKAWKTLKSQPGREKRWNHNQGVETLQSQPGGNALKHNQGVQRLKSRPMCGKRWNHNQGVKNA